MRAIYWTEKLGWGTLMCLIFIAVLSGNCGVVLAQEAKPQPFPGVEAKDLPRLSPQELKDYAELIEAEKKAIEASPKEAKVEALGADILKKRIREEALRQIAAKDSPNDAIAREKAKKESEKDAKREKERQKADSKARAFANLTGCTWESAGVHSYAVQYDTYAAQFTPRLVNPQDFAVSIDTSFKGIGVAVKSLCSDGAITLGFVWTRQDAYQSQSVRFDVVVRGIGSEGRKFLRIFPVTLYNYNTFNNRGYLQNDSPVWILE